MAAARGAEWSLEEDDFDTRTVPIGKQEWPVPFPIVRGDKGWSFDLEAGLYELLARRIGGNELAALNSLRAFVDAQRDYAAVDRDSDEVLVYAPSFVSGPGKKDGLYWETAEGSNEAAKSRRSRSSTSRAGISGGARPAIRSAATISAS